MGIFQDIHKLLRCNMLRILLDIETNAHTDGRWFVSAKSDVGGVVRG